MRYRRECVNRLSDRPCDIDHTDGRFMALCEGYWCVPSPGLPGSLPLVAQGPISLTILHGGTMTTGGPRIVPSGGDTVPGPTSGRHRRSPLASLDDPRAIPYIKRAIEREQCEAFRKNMEQVLVQLERGR